MAIPKDGPIGLETVCRELGETKSDVGSLCSSPKIDKRAKYKPYKFNHVKKVDDTWSVDRPGDLTDKDRADINYGMTPTGIERVDDGGLGEFVGKAWGQWQPPTPDTDWCRIDDFAGYNASGESTTVGDVRMYIKPFRDDDPMQPLKDSYICAEMLLAATASNFLRITDFKNPVSKKPFSELCFTLLFGKSDGSDLFERDKVFAVQSAPLGQYGEEAHILKLRLKVTDTVANVIRTGGDGYNIYVVCLCPKLTHVSAQDDGNSGVGPHDVYTVDNPVLVTANSFQFTDLISLNMWDNGFASTHFSEDIGTWTAPAPTTRTLVNAYAESPWPELDTPVYANNALGIGTTGGDLSTIIIASDYQSSNAYRFDNGTVRLAVFLYNSSGRYYGSKIIHQQTIGVTENAAGKKCLQFSSERFQAETYSMVLRGTDRDFNADVPKGTYNMQIALFYEAYGTYFNSETNKSTRCLLYPGTEEGNAEAYAERWLEILEAEGFFPDTAIYTAPLYFNNFVIG